MVVFTVLHNGLFFVCMKPLSTTTPVTMFIFLGAYLVK